MLRKIVLFLTCLGLHACDRADASIAPVQIETTDTSVGVAAHMVLRVTNVKSAVGTIRVALYADADSWAKDMKSGSTVNFCRVAELPAKIGEVETAFEDLAPGKYSIRLYHDVNDNGKVDKKQNFFVDMPSEPYGFSRNFNPVANMGTPNFEQCHVLLEESGPMRIEIALR